MPAAPLETKYHPSAVDLLLIKRLIGETSKQFLLQFLQNEFINIGKSHAERLIGKKYSPHSSSMIWVRQPSSYILDTFLSFQQNVWHREVNGYVYHVTGEMGPDFSPKTPVKSLTPQQIVRIHQLFREAKFDDPSGDVRCSSFSNIVDSFET